MKCPSCGAEAPEGSLYCARCGAKLNQSVSNAESVAGQGLPPAPSVPSPSSANLEAEQTYSSAPPEGPRFVEPPTARQPAETQEQKLWQGGYSGKDMYETWLLYAVISIGLLVLSLWAQTSWVSWASAVVIVLLWLYGTLVVAYRKLSVSYRLTTRRFFHEKGILRRVTDRIELIDIDDITVEQSIIDRLVGVGTIKITSSDRTHPELVLRGIKDARRVADLMDNARLEERRRRAVHLEAI